METTELIAQKKNFLKTIHDNLELWDGSLENATYILEKNEEKYEKLREIDHRLPREILEETQKEWQPQFHEMVKKQNKLMAVMTQEREYLKKQLAQLGKKNKVVSNYIAMQKKSLFVEKDY